MNTELHAPNGPGPARGAVLAERAQHYRLVAELFDDVCDLPPEERAAALARAQVPHDVVDEVRELLALDAERTGPLPVSDAWDETLPPDLGHRVRRIAAQSRSRGRYERIELLAEGGMGSVHLVWDRVLGRRVAMKTLRERKTHKALPADATRAVARFLEEARIAGQLDHPGIVSVHDLGIDANGRLWFTMPLVRGRTMHDVFTALKEGHDGWTLTRVLGLLLRVCESLAYVHGKGVVHRDLKPANIMVGRHNETYVMDWGLARLVDEPDVHDLRIVEGDPSETLPLRSGPDVPEGSWDASPLITLDGEILGTPAYMSPEQARGELDRVGPASDVYAMGCILYQLLAGRMPFARDDVPLGPRAIWHAVLSGPPEPLRHTAPDAPPEVAAICARAMARDVGDRYANMGALADDLRAYLEGRVVSAYARGPVAELRKWVGRNRGTALALAALLVLGAGAGFVLAYKEREGALMLEQQLDVLRVERLLREANEFHAADVPVLDDWLARARDVLERRERYVAALAEFDRVHHGARREPVELAEQAGLQRLTSIRDEYATELARIEAHLAGSADAEGSAQNATEHDRAVVARELHDLDGRVARLQTRLAGKRGERFADASVEAARAPLVSLVDGLAALASGPDAHVPRMAARRDELASLPARTVAAHADAWEQACRSIADPDECPLYEGLRIVPQVGLVPLGRDPESMLWEFWHVSSGERPERGDGGRYVIGSETGLVLVLVPGGTFWMGGQSHDPSAPGYVQRDVVGKVFAEADQVPVHEVSLAPYFLAKHELTQGQWWRLTGTLPSYNFAGITHASHSGALQDRATRSHPVESVSWVEADQHLSRWNLSLPSESQWERAARGGHGGAFGLSQRFRDVLHQINFADTSVDAFGLTRAVPLEHDDGFALTAPVDSWPGNAFGFVAILGNVSEWCRDDWAPYDEALSIDPISGQRFVPLTGLRCERGGGFLSPPNELTVSRRGYRAPRYQNYDLGLRPARAVDP